MRRKSTASGVRQPLLALVAVLGLIAVACSSDATSIEYKDPNQTALFEVPLNWNLYQGDEVNQAVLPFVTPTGATLSVVSAVTFDGAPARGTIDPAASLATSPYPVGSFVVRAVGSEDRDVLSRTILERSVLAQDYTPEPDQATALAGDWAFDDYEGIVRYLPFTDPNQAEGIVFFISVTDPADTRILTMAAGCSVQCWEVYGTEIAGVVNSWVVNTKQ